MSADSPTDIIDAPTLDEVREIGLGYLKAIPGNPITDWNSGASLRTLFEVDMFVLHDMVSKAMPDLANGAVPAFSTGDWLTQLAKHWFKIARTPPVTAVQQISLMCGGSNGPYTITAGTLWFQSSRTGNRYVNTTGGSLPTSGTLVIQARAEGPGAKYNDPAGTIRTLLTELPGVTCSNTASDFTPVVKTGSSTGSVTPSRTSGGTPPTRNTFLIRIDVSGQVTAGAWSYSRDGGRSWVSGGAMVSSFALPGGTTIAFANGVANPSFVAGDVYAFNTPGSCIVTQGADAEGDSAVTSRCNARWPDLSALPTEDRIVKWAKAASNEVLRVKLQADTLIPGKILATLAGAAGGVSEGAVAAVQAYVDPRAALGDLVVAQAATPFAITASGIVTVEASKKAFVQQAAQTAWQAYIASTDIGGRVRLAELVQAVMDAGAVDFTGFQLNGSASSYVLLTGTHVAVLPSGTPLLANQLTWEDL